jgi:beta-hydroxylase
MFSVLGPHSKIIPHRGPFRGAMRYHLGLVIPEDSQNCWIQVDSEKVHWKEGKSELFDDTFVHQVRNDTDQTRIILFCDVDRPSLSGLAAGLNSLVINSGIAQKLSFMNSRHEQVTK